MKKKKLKVAILYLLIILAAVTAACDSTQEQNGVTQKKEKAKYIPAKEINDLYDMELYGEVKSLSTNTYYAALENGKVSKGVIMRSIFNNNNRYILFNDKGYITDNVVFDKENIPEEKSIYFYNNMNKIIRILFFKYDTNEISNYKFSGKHEYNYKNDDIQIIRYNQDSIPIGVFVKIFDNNRKLTSHHAFDSIGSEVFRNVFEYDDKGNQTYEIRIYFDNNYRTELISEYNTDAKLIKEQIYLNNRLQNSKSFNYDESGYLIEKHLHEGSTRKKWTFKYDDKGNVIEETEYKVALISLFNTITTTDNYEYKYDKNGNWIKKVYFENGIPKSIVERKIDYYN
jgi:YD repeat-containing protein